ncbi:TcpQ domain-containing protein [Rosenbergiella nectarea]|uniref:TcpQ domain-containing protein n=1 Tax=Rosenbergiella nectarea TaxID=988801 RepID=UPI001BDA560C|nr:TcpQ domain-containing protein [Rosenbergiella nectarea]MBT0729342.1 hypothetical protein [Rosenbergiella nectarea subsp. apis]
MKKNILFLLFLYGSYSLASPLTREEIGFSKQTIHPPYYSGEWVVPEKQTLKSGIMNWVSSQQCDNPKIDRWSLKWLTNVDYRIDEALSFEGELHDALVSVLNLYRFAPKPLKAKVYKEQCLIVIYSPGDN